MDTKKKKCFFLNERRETREILTAENYCVFVLNIKLKKRQWKEENEDKENDRERESERVSEY